MNPAFFWHDYETFGKVPSRDAPAQFAGIRTDLELREIGKPVMMYCQPPRDALPDPVSCLITGITPQHCFEHGLPEPTFAAAVMEHLSEPGTIGVGYNTLRFDDEVTRFLFWRNLFDPYCREWSNGCSRWDLLDVVRTYAALRPEGIEWPRGEDGQISLRLEKLSAANGLMHDAAHDALSDVRATIALARLLRQANPRLFEYCLKLRHKDAVWEAIGPWSHEPEPFIHISAMFGSARRGLAIVWPLQIHPQNKNELLVWDLAFDPAEILDLSVSDIRQRLFTPSEQLPTGVKRLPIKGLHANKSPMVMRPLKLISPEVAERLNIDLQQQLQHAQSARLHQDALRNLPWAQIYQRDASLTRDVDQDLYGGFISREDRRVLDRIRQFQAEDWSRPLPYLEDSRLTTLVQRYQARHWLPTLSADGREQWLTHLRARLHDGHAGYLSLAQFAHQIDELGDQATELGDERQQTILENLLAWAEWLESQLDA